MRKTYVFLIIAVVASITSFVLYQSAFPPLQQVDLRFKDIRFRVRGTVQPDQRVIVVAIDGKSVREIGRWPWSREVIARLITGIKEYGAKVAALDIVFSEPQGNGPDQTLARAVGDSGNVVLGYFFRKDALSNVQSRETELARAKVKLLRLEDGVTELPLPEYSGADITLPVISSVNPDQGFFNVIPDEDGLYRSAQLFALWRGGIYPSLAMRATARYLGVEPLVDIALFGMRPVSLGGHTVPVNESGALALNYYGPGGTFRTVSAVDVIRRRLSPGCFRDALIFVGATEQGIYDLRATPFDPVHPGVEIHATAAANILEKRFLVRDGRTASMELGAIFIFPLLLALLLSITSRTMIGLGWFIFCVGLYLAVNQILFRIFFLDLSIVYPVVPLFLAYLGGEAYRNLVVEKKGRYLKRAFASYVSPELVEEIVKNPDHLRLGGEKRETTILFSDIRRFTTLSESLTPEELVRLLNAYLSPMTRIVLDEKGTLDKFIGDAVMAIFNAPLDLPEHPARACRAALRMIEHLGELNREFEAKGFPRIEIGIGINTGEAVVGNMGADIRFDYTAIGDTVNLASRLEGLTKQYGVSIIVSEAVREAAGECFLFRELDLVRVKGKHKPVSVHELLERGDDTIGEFAKGLGFYRRQDFDGALEIFSGLAERGDRVSELYVERCGKFLANPPAPDWDGVFDALRK